MECFQLTRISHLIKQIQYGSFLFYILLRIFSLPDQFGSTSNQSMRVRGLIEHKKCLAKKPDIGLTIYVHEGVANSGYMVFFPSIFHYRQKHCAFRIRFCFRTNTMGQRSVAEERF